MIRLPRTSRALNRNGWAKDFQWHLVCIIYILHAFRDMIIVLAFCLIARQRRVAYMHEYSRLLLHDLILFLFFFCQIHNENQRSAISDSRPLIPASRKAKPDCVRANEILQSSQTWLIKSSVSFPKWKKINENGIFSDGKHACIFSSIGFSEKKILIRITWHLRNEAILFSLRCDKLSLEHSGKS